MNLFGYQLSRPSRQMCLAALAGAVALFLLLTAVRFVLLPEPVHHHGNFAVFINGTRENFEGDLYYEEVQSCSAEFSGPRTRVHMHQPENNVVHVHDEGATWGNLFENLGWSLGNSLLSTGQEVYQPNTDSDLVFILNDQETRNIANKIINSEDRLLVSYGPSSTDRDAEYAQVEQTAALFNEQKDPGACQGSDTESLTSRLRRAIIF